MGRKESSPRLTLGRAPLAAGGEVELGAEKGASTFPPQERLWRLVSFFFKISAWRGNCRLQAGTLLPSPPGAQPNASLPGRGLSVRAWAVLPGPLHHSTEERGEYSNRPKANSSMCPGQRQGRISVQVLRNETTVREMTRDWVKAGEQKGGNYKLRSEKRNGLLASIVKKFLSHTK